MQPIFGIVFVYFMRIYKIHLILAENEYYKLKRSLPDPSDFIVDWKDDKPGNLQVQVQVHPGELWVSKQRLHIVLEASKSAGYVPKICGIVHPLHLC